MLFRSCQLELCEDLREAVHGRERRLQLVHEHPPRFLVFDSVPDNVGCEYLEPFTDVASFLRDSDAALQRCHCRASMPRHAERCTSLRRQDDTPDENRECDDGSERLRRQQNETDGRRKQKQNRFNGETSPPSRDQRRA